MNSFTKLLRRQQHTHTQTTITAVLSIQHV